MLEAHSKDHIRLVSQLTKWHKNIPRLQRSCSSGIPWDTILSGGQYNGNLSNLSPFSFGVINVFVIFIFPFEVTKIQQILCYNKDTSIWCIFRSESFKRKLTIWTEVIFWTLMELDFILKNSYLFAMSDIAILMNIRKLTLMNNSI